MSSKKGIKLSLGEFMGPPSKVNALPTGPAERGPDDDGSFQRHRPRRDDDSNSGYEPSRSDGDNNWRRGGGGGGGGGGASSMSGNANSSGYNNYPDRGEHQQQRSSGRDGGFHSDRNRGYQHEPEADRTETGNWRSGGGGGGRESMSSNRGGYDRPPPSTAASAERPRLQLKSRTAPTPTTATVSPRDSTVLAPVEPPLEQQQDETTTTTAQPSPTSDTPTTTKAPKEEEPTDNNTKDDAKPEQDSPVDKAEAGSPVTKQRNKGEPKKREPDVVNSRAAAFGSAPEHKREVSFR